MMLPIFVSVFSVRISTPRARPKRTQIPIHIAHHTGNPSLWLFVLEKNCLQLLCHILAIEDSGMIETIHRVSPNSFNPTSRAIVVAIKSWPVTASIQVRPRLAVVKGVMSPKPRVVRTTKL